ncbi:hypothetical protein AB664_38460 [Brucella anthropi]|uniref:SapC family protein n=1 Tax=Brucella anthropi TaxID=529 RepID=A0A656Z7Z0_BRUAN|nr:hypothetical protein AB664_38460 [Brucella anthropi]
MASAPEQCSPAARRRVRAGRPVLPNRLLQRRICQTYGCARAEGRPESVPRPDRILEGRDLCPGLPPRYPFIVTDFTDQSGQLLAIDTASDRFTDIGSSDDAEPLFDEKGGPSRMTAEAMAFCNAFHQDHLRGEKFGAALLDQGLLVHRHANMQFPDNSRYTLDGFQVVDEEKFRSLSDPDLLLDWHHKGWLAAIILHLASMNNWETLLLLNAEQNTAEQGAA